jgi:hypothetical protein
MARLLAVSGAGDDPRAWNWRLWLSHRRQRRELRSAIEPTTVAADAAQHHVAEIGVAIADVEMTLARYGPVLVIGVWDDDQDAPIYLISSLTDADAADGALPDALSD